MLVIFLLNLILYDCSTGWYQIEFILTDLCLSKTNLISQFLLRLIHTRMVLLREVVLALDILLSFAILVLMTHQLDVLVW